MAPELLDMILGLFNREYRWDNPMTPQTTRSKRSSGFSFTRPATPSSTCPRAIPITGLEEDAADQFATMTMLSPRSAMARLQRGDPVPGASTEPGRARSHRLLGRARPARAARHEHPLLAVRVRPVRVRVHPHPLPRRHRPARALRSRVPAGQILLANPTRPARQMRPPPASGSVAGGSDPVGFASHLGRPVPGPERPSGAGRAAAAARPGVCEVGWDGWPPGSVLRRARLGERALRERAERK